MPLVDIQLIKGVFTPAQKTAMISQVTDAMVPVEGEAMRPVTWVRVQEIESGEWAIGGNTLTAEGRQGDGRREVAVAQPHLRPAPPTGGPGEWARSAGATRKRPMSGSRRGSGRATRRAALDLGYLSRSLHHGWPQHDVGIVLWSLSVAANDWQPRERLPRAYVYNPHQRCAGPGMGYGFPCDGGADPSTSSVVRASRT